jgi:hypothetical protein
VPDMACSPQYTHNNGVGGTWTDCVPLGTHNDVQAIKACAASFTAASCFYPPAGAECAGKGIAYANSPGNWTVFVYYGTYIGKVILPGNDCLLGGSPSSWN